MSLRLTLEQLGMPPIRTEHDGHRIVRVLYPNLVRRGSATDPDDLSVGYAYIWPLARPPRLGDRVILEEAGGDIGIVVGFNTQYPGELLAVHALATRARQGAR